jgi:hypothetical protein
MNLVMEERYMLWVDDMGESTREGDKREKETEARDRRSYM